MQFFITRVIFEVVFWSNIFLLVSLLNQSLAIKQVTSMLHLSAHLYVRPTFQNQAFKVSWLITVYGAMLRAQFKSYNRLS